jgi:two-component system, NarL family, sensor histidine kinase UhpB
MKPLRILMLEDSPLDARIIQKTLSNSLNDFEFTVVNNGNDYTAKLNEQEFDVILCDYQVPDFDAVKALHIRNNKDSSIPFILVSGAVSEVVAIDMIKDGANDYILKDRLQRLPVAIEKAVKKQQLKFDKQSLEQSLSELTERFQLASKTSFDVIWDYDIKKDLVYCSSAIEKIIGTSVKENLQFRFLKTFIHPDDLPTVERSFIQIIKSTENRWRKIFRVIRNDTSIVWVNTNAMILRSKNETAIRVVGVMHDITEVRKLQHELVEQEMQSQKQIAKITLQAQEKERMEIGKELHDNVNQLLATAKIMIDTARNIPDMHDLCLAKSQESIMEAITELRNLAHSMMPPPFESNDFENILHDLAYKINLTGKINLQLLLPEKDKLGSINNQIKLVLYRIIQEQVSNILKHARAKNAFISIDVINSYVTLNMEDDGVGFNLQKRSKGIGLKNIESRCNLFAGTMDLITSPGEGCVMRIQIPVKSTVYV